MSLSPEQERISAELTAHIRGQIGSHGGWLSFERFMELALYAPGLGYYSAGATKIGPGGDFVTAPESSDLFSRCLAAQCREVLSATGGDILELGAGTGRMAATVLTALAQQGALPDRYLILEVSADLAARQQDRIARLPAVLSSRVQWLARLPAAPLDGLILANEVLDALPTRRIVLHQGVLHERGVALSPGGELIDADMRADAALEATWAQVEAALPWPLPDGYSTELCTRVTPWIATLAPLLTRGAFVLFDYGLPRAQLYHPQRTHGTLRCHFRQTAHDNPYINIGVQDITAWVDFTRVAEAAVEGGLDVAFTTQAGFLLACGIERELLAAGEDVVAQARMAGEARRLLLPGEMGEAFKVMALTRGLPQSLTGFTLQDLTASL